MTEISVLCAGEGPAHQFTARAREAEAAGFDAYFLADERFFLEPFQLLALAAEHTTNIRLGPCVVDPYTTHPALAARSVATLDQISGGRAVLVLGAGKSGFRELGIERVRSAARLREAVTLIRTLFAEGGADFQGTEVQFNSGTLNIETRPDIPIWVATEGRLTLEMAGELADAVMVSSVATPERVRWALDCVSRGAARAGRPRPPVHVRLDTAVAPDPAAARDAVRFVVLRHLIANMSKPEFVAEHGLDGALIESLEALDYRGFSRDGDRIRGAAHLVPDRLLVPFVLSGTPVEVAAQARELAGAVEGIIVYPHPVGDLGWSETAAAIGAALGRPRSP